MACSSGTRSIDLSHSLQVVSRKGCHGHGRRKTCARVGPTPVCFWTCPSRGNTNWEPNCQHPCRCRRDNLTRQRHRHLRVPGCERESSLAPQVRFAAEIVSRWSEKSADPSITPLAGPYQISALVPLAQHAQQARAPAVTILPYEGLFRGTVSSSAFPERDVTHAC